MFIQILYEWLLYSCWTVMYLSHLFIILQKGFLAGIGSRYLYRFIMTPRLSGIMREATRKPSEKSHWRWGFVLTFAQESLLANSLDFSFEGNCCCLHQIKWIGRVNEYPTMHFKGNPRHTQTMNDGIYDVDWVFLVTPVKNGIVGMLLTCPIELSHPKIGCRFFAEIKTLFCNTRQKRTSGFSYYCKKINKLEFCFNFHIFSSIFSLVL